MNKRVTVCSAPDDKPVNSEYYQDRAGSSAREPLNNTPLRQAERLFKNKQLNAEVDVDLSLAKDL